MIIIEAIKLFLQDLEFRIVLGIILDNACVVNHIVRYRHYQHCEIPRVVCWRHPQLCRDLRCDSTPAFLSFRWRKGSPTDRHIWRFCSALGAKSKRLTHACGTISFISRIKEDARVHWRRATFNFIRAPDVSQYWTKMWKTSSNYHHARCFIGRWPDGTRIIFNHVIFPVFNYCHRHLRSIFARWKTRLSQGYPAGALQRRSKHVFHASVRRGSIRCAIRVYAANS